MNITKLLILIKCIYFLTCIKCYYFYIYVATIIIIIIIIFSFTFAEMVICNAFDKNMHCIIAVLKRK